MNRFHIKTNILFLSTSAFAVFLIIICTIISCQKSNTINDVPNSNIATLRTPSVTFEGLYACNTDTNSAFPGSSPMGYTDYCWNSPIIDGVVERVTWAHLEPTKLTNNFSFLKTECDSALTEGKGIMLDIFGGQNAPSWAYGSAFKNLWIPAHSACAHIPRPWSTTYISNWTYFMAQLSTYLTSTHVTVGGVSHELMDAIKLVKVGGCCTEYTSELRVPNDNVNTTCDGTLTDSAQWAGDANYTTTKMTVSIDSMVQAVITYFPNTVLPLPVIAGGNAFTVTPSCTPLANQDCISPSIFSYLNTNLSSADYFMGMYESLNTGSNDGSICKMLTDPTHGMQAVYHCQIGYQLDAASFGNNGSPVIDCTNLYNALMKGWNESARYFEIFKPDFENNCTGESCSCSTESYTYPEAATAAFYTYLHSHENKVIYQK
jgi:hypothetical protein